MSDKSSCPVVLEYIQLNCDICGTPMQYSYTYSWFRQLWNFLTKDPCCNSDRIHVHVCTTLNKGSLLSCRHKQVEKEKYPRIEYTIQYSSTTGKLVHSEHVK